MVGGKPVQGAANNQQAAQVLKDKLAYAKKRWGCTLFYIDSTVVVTGESLNPEVFKTVARSEEHTSELQSLTNLVCRLLLEKKKKIKKARTATTTYARQEEHTIALM